MTQKLIVATFKDLDVAQRAARDFRNFEIDDGGFKIESGVMVQKDVAGKLTVIEKYTQPFWGTVIGAVTGGLVGLLGGPVGVIAGLTVGAGAGLAGGGYTKGGLAQAGNRQRRQNGGSGDAHGGTP